MTILLVGADGMVGHELRSSLAPLGAVVALNRAGADLSVPESLRDVVRRHRPSMIVNAAAYTAVDKAETDSETAFAVNAKAPGVLAEEAEALGAVLVHYSTDYVFDGSKASPYVESDVVNPLSVYGSSKLLGERAIQVCRKHLIFRTSWVISARGSNFVKTMLKLAKERPQLRVVADQHGAPTSAAVLAHVTAKLLTQVKEYPTHEPRWGLYHLVPQGETTWHALACYVIDKALAMGLALQASSQTVTAIKTNEYPTPARRPANSRLATEKLSAAFDLTLPRWTAGVDSVLEKLIPEMRQ
jgi:dTDP-4-dehydrorhamnose reductase